MPNFAEWWRKIKSNWNLLFTAAAWILAIITSVIVSPNGVFNDESNLVPWVTRLAAFIVAVLIGLTFLVGAKFNQRRHLVPWALIALALLLVSIWGTIRYYDRYYALTCKCDEQRVLQGSVYRDRQGLAQFFPQRFDCSNLCQSFKDKQGKVRPDLVWTQDSINESRNKLVYSYLLCVPMMALTIISISQAIYCSRKRRVQKRSQNRPTISKQRSETSQKTTSTN
jgi:hypothetical protein